MSIGVEKVNGGIVTGQWTEGELYYFRVTGPAGAFAGSFSDEDKPVPDGGAAEAIYKILAQYGTPVIFEIKSVTQVDVAMAYGSGSMLDENGAATAPQADVQDLGAAVTFKRYGLESPGALNNAVTADGGFLRDTASLDFSSATVTVGDFQVADL